MKRGDLVFIEWDDIRTDLSTEEDSVPLKAIAVGEVHQLAKQWVRLRSGWYVNPEWKIKDTIVIPRGCITKVRVLK